jgi:hypothetical protein
METKKPVTLKDQLFGGGLTKLLWAILLLFMVAGLCGVVWDLSDADILGTGQSLDTGSAATMLISSIVIACVIFACVTFLPEQKAKRQA